MITPTHETDAAPPERNSLGLIFLAGAIKYWWLKKCGRPGCGQILPEDAEVCTREYTDAQTGQRRLCNSSNVHELWGGPEHQDYVAWRDLVSIWLIEAGYLVYRPHEAFKGTWDPRAQMVNDAAIAASDLMLVLSPEGILTEGTDEEVVYAQRVNTGVLYAPPEVEIRHLIFAIETLRGQDWPHQLLVNRV